ncbi:MAG: tetratricopeptide repeat protein [Sorangiineae bacterium]|nr:tetratricopeptide repeat protein [Sorangiineae bacterium]MEB2343317.1 tetratricopeptide repeat protein [Deltaproteobacteria bacterium]
MPHPVRPSDSPARAPDQSLVASTIARLRAEHDVADPGTPRALLLHELGVLEELLGDEAAAARDQLGAVNAEPEFREPLERLIAIIERRQSYKNLGKLLDRLVQVADTPDERVRALIESAAHLADHEGDLAGARQALEEATQTRPEDSAAWLMLEIVAGKLDDGATRLRCLNERARRTQHPSWRALLLIDAASLELAAGDVEAALGALDGALEQKSDATFFALMALEELGRREERHEVLARSLEAQATLVLRAADDAATGDALGVPHHRRNAGYAADAWLRAADAHRAMGDVERAVSLLDQALERLPGEPALLHARLGVADAAGDITTAARVARIGLDQGVTGSAAAALWLRIAEAAAAEGQGPVALEAVGKALVEDHGSIQASALQLDWLAGGQDPQALASALETAAAEFPSDEAKARYFLLAADAWARLAGDVQGAKAALSQAGMTGAGPGVLARLGRLLASLVGDEGWYEESTRRLLTAGASEGEHAGLAFEFARGRLLRGQRAAGERALTALAQAAGGAWLGNALRAFALDFVVERSDGAGQSLPPPASEPTSPLLELAAAETDPRVARGLKLLVAERAIRRHELDTAVGLLEELHESDVSDVTVAATLATLCRARENPRRAAEVLSASALATEDAELGGALRLEAGMLFWLSGARGEAVESFSAAAALTPASGSTIRAWALRAAEPDDLDARRSALEAASAEAEPSLQHLERFGLEVGAGGDANDAALALAAIGDQAPADLGRAALLAQSLWVGPHEGPGARDEALATLADLSAECEALARGAAYQLELEAQRELSDPSVREASAARWAASDHSAAAGLEWLAATLATKDVSAEALARHRLASTFEGELRTAVLASARLVESLGGADAVPLIASTEPSAQLMNLELALPGSDPRRRAAALEGLDASLGPDAAPLARAMAGWNRLAAGDVAGATDSFRAVAEACPGEVTGWQGLEAAGEASGDRRSVAEACAALGDLVEDDSAGAECWERAALILLDELGEEAAGEFALGRAVERDIGRFVAFDRLFRLVRAKKNGPRLLELVNARLAVADDPEEIAKLFWERARVLRGAGDREGALAALENVTMLEPDHVGALALAGEIYITTGKFAEAAASLARLSTLDEAPAKQRLMSGVAAVDLYENKLGELDQALEVLASLYRGGLSTEPVRERLARAAAKAEAWELATDVLEQLMTERESPAGRVEAARLAMAIRRDRFERPESAASAVEQLLRDEPGDGEALDLVLTGVFPDALTLALLGAGRSALVAEAMASPLDPERVDRLSRIALRLGDAPLRQATLGALTALGHGSSEIDRELRVLDERVARLPQMAIDERALPDLCDPSDAGPVPALMLALAETFAEALGPGLVALGVGKRERVDPKAGLPVRNEIAAWAGALGLGDFELYVGGPDPNAVHGVPGEVPAIVVGAAVSAPLTPTHRQALARALFALKRGVTILQHRDPTDIAALVVAACHVGGHAVPSPQYSMLAEFTRVLGKEMNRKVRRTLPELAAAVARSGQDVVAWVAAATSSLDRMAAIAAGDVSCVLGDAGGRGKPALSHHGEERAARLLAFVLSPTYLRLREALGMGVR